MLGLFPSYLFKFQICKMTIPKPKPKSEKVIRTESEKYFTKFSTTFSSSSKK